MLAITVVAIAGLGVYSLFHSGMDSYHMSDASQEMIEIANVFTDLASADLTSNTSADVLVQNLQNSGRLPSRYFATVDGKLVMVNSYAALQFSASTAYSFSVNVPLGCLDESSTVPAQFCSAVQDVYTCGKDTLSSNPCMRYLPLTFNLSD